jgi:hypothetical protein
MQIEMLACIAIEDRATTKRIIFRIRTFLCSLEGRFYFAKIIGRNRKSIEMQIIPANEHVCVQHWRKAREVLNGTGVRPVSGVGKHGRAGRAT